MKKLLTVLLSAALVLTMFASCSKKDGNENGNDNNKNASETDLVIGGIGPLTGDYANYGNSVKNGATLAAKEINEAGGVNGYTFVVNFQDSQGDPDSAVSAYGKLMDSGMKVSLGGVLSGETTSVVAAAKDDGILVLTPSGSAKAAIEGSDTAFRVCFSDPSQGTASAKYINDNNLPKDVAVFYASDVDYSKGLYDTFAAEAKKLGINIKEVQTFTADSSTDFSTQIAAIKNSGVKLIFMPIYAAEAATFLTQAKAAKAFSDDTIYYGCDGLDGILQKIDNPENTENVMMLTPYAADAPDEKTQHFVSTYKDAYNAVPDQFAADGYDAVYAIKAAIEEAGLKPGAEDDFNAKIVDAMTKITVEGVTGTMTWGADGETNKAALAMIIHDGVASLYNADEAEAPAADAETPAADGAEAEADAETAAE